MKSLFLLAVLTIFNFTLVNSQTLVVSDACQPEVDGGYLISDEINGKPSYYHEAVNGYTYTVYWTGLRWELIGSDNSLGAYNELDTPIPPESSTSPWTPVLCNPTGNFTYVQAVILTDSCASKVDGAYLISADINGRPSYVHDAGNGDVYTIYWTGSRWELIGSENSIGSYNDLDTPKPPATELAPWTPVLCDPTGIFTGDVSTATLTIEEVEPILEKNLFPNPAYNEITISGLNQKENYKIFNYLGVEILDGVIGNNETIEIKNFAVGLYFLKLNNGSVFRFLKK